jgi:hypothetical protein
VNRHSGARKPNSHKGFGDFSLYYPSIFIHIYVFYKYVLTAILQSITLSLLCPA